MLAGTGRCRASLFGDPQVHPAGVVSHFPAVCRGMSLEKAGLGELSVDTNSPPSAPGVGAVGDWAGGCVVRRNLLSSHTPFRSLLLNPCIQV